MTLLEKRLGNSSYVSVTAAGVDYSRFDFDQFKEKLYSGFWDFQGEFGIQIEDQQQRKSELYGVFRPFRRRAALTKPLQVEGLHDEGVTFSSELLDQLGTFFRRLAAIDPPTRESTTYWEGEFKKVLVTRIMPERQWWKGMFIDLYVQSDSVIDRLSLMDERSRRVLHESDHWQRYEIVRRYVRTVQEEAGHYRKEKNELRYTDTLNLLQRHASYLRPALFRNGDDYQYFLLGFHHANFHIEDIHANVLKYFAEQRTLEGYVSQFNVAARKLELFGSNEIKLGRHHQIFGKDVTKDELNDSYDKVAKSGKKMRSPITISDDLWSLGFLTLKRKRWRSLESSKASYALLKIKGRKPVLQTTLPGIEQKVELEEEDFSPRKAPELFF